MESKLRYNKLSEYLKNKYGLRTLKICIDGHFTCPNRDGTKGFGGCIFCSEKGSGEHLYENLDINKQIDNYFLSYKSDRASSHIAYFQNFTNTYDTIENLKKRYDVILNYPTFKVLDIATRPDSINEDICKLLSSYNEKYDVWVELGLQTANETTGKLLNRCYTNDEFTETVSLLNKYHIKVICHIMIGLPGENHEDLINTIKFINKHNLFGLKIHSTYIVKNTKLEEMYKNNEYSPITLENYIEEACFVLTHINKDIIIHKISGDAPKDILVAPSWNANKKPIINGITKYLENNNLYQGMFYNQF